MPVAIAERALVTSALRGDVSRTECHIVQVGIDGALFVVVIKFAVIEPRMPNRQVENICPRCAGIPPSRKIALAAFVHKQVRDRMIDLNVVQVPLEPKQGDDGDANPDVIDRQ